IAAANAARDTVRRDDRGRIAGSVRGTAGTTTWTVGGATDGRQTTNRSGGRIVYGSAGDRCSHATWAASARGTSAAGTGTSAAGTGPGAAGTGTSATTTTGAAATGRAGRGWRCARRIAEDEGASAERRTGNQRPALGTERALGLHGITGAAEIQAEDLAGT